MLRLFLIGLVVVLGVALAVSFAVTQDGKYVTPEGAGSVTVNTKEFEAFPLPDYAAAALTEEYKSYFIEVEPGIKIHVLEVGSGFPVYLQHGNPTSGFLYRKVAAHLPTDRVRLIMPTMAGLGFSSKVPASAHTLDNHTRWMNGVLTELQIEEVVYVGQDWGGPVGMGALALSPGLLKGAVIMNTGLNAPKEKRALSQAHATVKTPVVGELLLEVFVSIFDRLPELQGDPSSIPPSVSDLYGRPVLESGNAKAPVALMRMVPDGPDHRSAANMRTIEAYVQALDIPVELVWGANDPILGEALSVMAQNFPDAPVLETPAGHFLQEEVPEEIAAAIMRVVDKTQSDTETSAPQDAPGDEE